MEKQKLNSPKTLHIKVDSTLKYLQVFNGILELTNKELEVLSLLIDLGEGDDLCSMGNKTIVAKQMNIEDPNALNSYVKRLKDKKAIIQTKDGYKLNKAIQKHPESLIKITVEQ